MKENNRNSKDLHMKNILHNKKEVKIINQIVDIKKVNKQNSINFIKKSNAGKKPSPHKLEPIKVRLIPINNISNSKVRKSKNNKQSNFIMNKGSKSNNSLFLSSPHCSNLENRNISHHKNNKKINHTDNKNDKKEEKDNKNNENYNTPYRKILNIKNKQTFSPSTNVIIKNFNYNNVYNINIDNDNEKIQNKNNIRYSNKSATKNNHHENNLTTFNNNDNESLSKYSNKKFTYNKPKTVNSINTPYILSKRNKSKENILINENKERNKTLKINETVYSRFISEGNSLKNCRNNMFISSLIKSESKLDNNQKRKIFAQTPNKNKTISNFNMTFKKSNFNDYNLTSQKINNNLNEIYRNHFSNNNSYSNINFKNPGANNFYSISSSSLNNTFIKRNISNSPKLTHKYCHKTENILDINNNDDNDNINDNDLIINLNDLFIFEDRINDIISAFNKTNNIYDIEASNESTEFFNFYSKSSLKEIFPIFFKENNKLIIESSINLSIFFITILYNLSINNFLFNDLISTINNILIYLKINFSLYIKQIQIYYGMNIVKKKYIYFLPFNNFLSNNNIKDVEEEDDITYKIYQNCRLMTNELKIIMNYYQKIDLNYYNYFIDIFNNISIQKEDNLINDFFNKVHNTISSFNLITVNKNNISNNNINIIKDNIKDNTFKKYRTKSNLDSLSPFKKNSLENLSIKNDKIYQKSPFHSIKKEIKKDDINKIEIPYIKAPCQKKFTLILDLNKTLAFYSKDGVSLRNGLFSFLSIIKPYYELISFSCDSNEITQNILKEIESQDFYFDYNLSREHSILYENTLVKDISLIGRDISKIIMVDDDENCFKLNKENGIKISSYKGDDNDNILFELKKLLLLIYNKNYDDVRDAIKEYSNDIRYKISLE